MFSQRVSIVNFQSHLCSLLHHDDMTAADDQDEDDAVVTLHTPQAIAADKQGPSTPGPRLAALNFDRAGRSARHSSRGGRQEGGGAAAGSEAVDKISLEHETPVMVREAVMLMEQPHAPHEHACSSDD